MSGPIIGGQVGGRADPEAAHRVGAGAPGSAGRRTPRPRRWRGWPPSTSGRRDRTPSARGRGSRASRSAAAVITSAFLPLVSAMQAQRGLPVEEQPRGVVGAGEHDGVDVRMGDEALADVVVRAAARTAARRQVRRRPSSCWARIAAVSTVSGAGLRMTALPAASAPSTPPAGIAYGKFHGEATTTTPCGSNARHASARQPWSP